MATYQYNTSAKQEKALDWMVRRANKGKANGELVTKAQMVDSILDGAFKSYLEQFEEYIARRVSEEYRKAVAATQTGVRTTLGVNPDAEE